MLRRTAYLASITCILSMLVATDVRATAQRTFVASNGNDANPCSLVLPCRAFAAAIAQTADGGEVIVLDSAGYGPVTITQSVSIIAPAGVYAGISVPVSATGISITGRAIIKLRGLTINGTVGSTYGIGMLAAGVLVVDDCVISNFTSATGATGLFIGAGVFANISGTTVSNNDFGVVVVDGATAKITHSQIFRHIWDGVLLWGTGTGSITNVFLTDSVITGLAPGTAGQCVHNITLAGATGNISATRVTVSNCVSGFFNQSGGAGTITVSNSMVTGNINGFYNLSGAFVSLGTSQVSGNTNDIVGAITNIGGK